MTTVEWAAHVECEPGLQVILKSLDDGAGLWLQGGLGRGKTHLLRAVADLLDKPREPYQAPAGRWVVATVDLDRVPSDRHGILAAVADSFIAAATDRSPGVKLESHPPHEWMAWLDRGPGALELETIEREFQRRLGVGLVEARRRRGVDLVSQLLRDIAAAEGWPLPAMLGPAERLSQLYDQLEGQAELRVAVLLDNVDLAPPAEIEPLLVAIARDLPEVYHQPWSLLAAGADPPPAALRARLALHELGPRFRPLAAGLADAAPDGLTEDAWHLLRELTCAHARPLELASAVVREALAETARRPLISEDLLASASLCEWLRAQLPDNWAAHGEPDDERHPGVTRYERLLLVRAAAGLGSALPMEALEDESRTVRQALEVAPALRLGEQLRLEPRNADELLMFRAVSGEAERITRRQLTAIRAERLRLLPPEMPRQVTWDNLTYRGEVVAGESLHPLWGEPLPPELAFRIVVLTEPHRLAHVRLRDPRIIVLSPGPLRPDELPELLQTATTRIVAQQHPEATVRTAARAWMSGRAAAALQQAAATLSDGDAVAEPPPLPSWSVATRRHPLHAWPALLLRPRFNALYTRRSLWLDADQLDEPLTEGQLGEVWRILRDDEMAAQTSIREALRLGPATEPPGFVELRSQLEAHGGALPATDALARLTAPPVGLVPGLVRLYLLALVLRNEPPLLAELAGLSNDLERLTARGLRRYDWDQLRGVQIRRLVRADTRSWGELLPFAQAIQPDIATGLTPEAVSLGRTRLLEALSRLAEQVSQTSRDLRYLADMLHQDLPEPVISELARLRRVAQRSSVEAFDRYLKDLYDAEPKCWDAAIASFQRWRQVSAAAHELSQLYEYARDAILPAQHPLDADRLALLGQLRLSRLLDHPALVRSLLAQGDHFRRQYAQTYLAARPGIAPHVFPTDASVLSLSLVAGPASPPAPSQPGWALCRACQRLPTAPRLPVPPPVDP